MTDFQIQEDTRVRAGGDQMSCDLDGEAAILHLPSGCYYGLDEVGATVWRLLAEPVRVGDIQRAVEEEYEVEHEICARDVRHLLGELVNAGIVEIVE
jgi:hypothetical protein